MRIAEIIADIEYNEQHKNDEGFIPRIHTASVRGFINSNNSISASHKYLRLDTTENNNRNIRATITGKVTNIELKETHIELKILRCCYEKQYELCERKYGSGLYNVYTRFIGCAWEYVPFTIIIKKETPIAEECLKQKISEGDILTLKGHTCKQFFLGEEIDANNSIRKHS